MKLLLATLFILLSSCDYVDQEVNKLDCGTYCMMTTVFSYENWQPSLLSLTLVYEHPELPAKYFGNGCWFVPEINDSIKIMFRQKGEEILKNRKAKLK